MVSLSSRDASFAAIFFCAEAIVQKNNIDIIVISMFSMYITYASQPTNVRLAVLILYLLRKVFISGLVSRLRFAC